MLPLQGPTGNDSKLLGAFKEVERELTAFGVQTLDHKDKAGISRFAKQALASDSFTLQ